MVVHGACRRRCGTDESTSSGDGWTFKDGSPSLVRAFPTWNARSMFAHIRPIARSATSAGG
jgi:hypothetical protein